MSDALRTFKKPVLVGLLSICFLVAGYVTGVSAKSLRNQPPGAPPGPPPAMTIQIFNPADNTYNIYPVISAGAPSSTDAWMQAYFGLTNAQIASGNLPYPRTGIPRIYINCCDATKGENGIPPGGSVTLTLPLYSPVGTNPIPNPKNPTPPGSFADWWQGGHVEMFANPTSTGQPPAALLTLYNGETPNSLPLYAGMAPTCDGTPSNTSACTLHFFFSTASIGNSVPMQLLEYTLGANPVNPDNAKPGQPHFLFDPEDVDYDVSYVNNALLPAVMEPYGNPLIGWIGSDRTIDDFTAAMTKFLNTANLGQGWPVYAGTAKIASPLEFFLDFTPDHYTPKLTDSAPVTGLITWLDDCTRANNPPNYPICQKIRDVVGLLQANYQNYKKNFHSKKEWGCNASEEPIALTKEKLRAHLWGWGPFNEHCASNANQLYDTPGYEDKSPTHTYIQVKKEFDELQYWETKGNTPGKFDPYVALIHSPDFINAPYTYAYSVDDAFGNMQTRGTGLIIEVGGTGDLPNPDHATPNVHIPFGLSSTDNNKHVTVSFEKYGRCTTDPAKFTPVNPNFTSFDVPVGVDNKTITNCPIVFVDNYNRTYQFKLKNGPPWVDFTGKNPEPTPPGKKPIDCSGNTPDINRTWCSNIYAYQTVDPHDPAARFVYVVSVGAPAPIPPSPGDGNGRGGH